MVFISEECRRNYVILSYWLFFSSVFFTFFRLTWYKLLTILVDKLVTDDDCDITYRSCSFHDLINHFHWISEAGGERGGDILKIVQSISSISDAVISELCLIWNSVYLSRQQHSTLSRIFERYKEDRVESRNTSGLIKDKNPLKSKSIISVLSQSSPQMMNNALSK